MRAEQSRAEQSRAEQRNTVIDIIKALGIILMVMGHAGAPITQWIYLFHMSLFFIVSGYCIGDNYSDNFSGLKLFIKKKIKTLYIPCLLFNTSLLILHNLLIRLYFLDDKIYNLKSIFIGLVKCILFSGGGELGGAMWFLRTMFISSIIYIFIEYFLKSRNIKEFEIIKSLFFLSLLFFSWIIPYNMPGYKYVNCLTVLSLYQIGHLLKKYMIKIKKLYFIPCFLILVICGKYGVQIDLNANQICNPVIFIICSISGFVVCYTISQLFLLFEDQKFLKYIGRHTLSIMMLHFLAFKIVIFIQIIIGYGKINDLKSYPCYIVNSGWWLVYSIVGVLVPLWINYLYQRIKKLRIDKW